MTTAGSNYFGLLQLRSNGQLRANRRGHFVECPSHPVTTWELEFRSLSFHFRNEGRHGALRCFLEALSPKGCLVLAQQDQDGAPARASQPPPTCRAAVDCQEDDQTLFSRAALVETPLTASGGERPSESNRGD